MLFLLPLLPSLKRSFKAGSKPETRRADPVKAAARKRQRKARKACRKGTR
jgi:hypothetical protein